MITHLEHIVTKKHYRNRLDFFSKEYCEAAEKGLLVAKYDNSVFDYLDWTKEPIESLSTLTYQRALQLREKHNYIIVYFSGGSDSTAVLNAFINNKIHVDEVVINAFTDMPDRRYNGEDTLDYLRFIKYEGKVNIVNINSSLIRTFCRDQLWLKHKYFAGCLHTLSRMSIPFFEENNLIPYTNRPTNVGHVYGGTCPIILVKNNKYYCQFPYRNIGGNTWEDSLSLFYSSAEFPKLHLKQSHIIAKYFREHYPEEKVIIESTLKFRRIYKSLIRDPWNLALDFQKNHHSSGLKNIFDPRSETYDLLKFYASKDISIVRDYRDSVVNDYINTPLYKKYNNTGALAIKDMVQFYLFDS